jgi:hypothetical protein
VNDEGVVVGHWNVDETYVSVFFRDGKVIQKTGSGLLPSVLPKLTKANYDRIEVGMGEADLYALLGHPTSSALLDDVLKLQWDDVAAVDRNIEIDLVDGKVTSKSNKGLE